MIQVGNSHRGMGFLLFRPLDADLAQQRDLTRSGREIVVVLYVVVAAIEIILFIVESNLISSHPTFILIKMTSFKLSYLQYLERLLLLLPVVLHHHSNVSGCYH